MPKSEDSNETYWFPPPRGWDTKTEMHRSRTASFAEAWTTKTTRQSEVAQWTHIQIWLDQINTGQWSPPSHRKLLCWILSLIRKAQIRHWNQQWLLSIADTHRWKHSFQSKLAHINKSEGRHHGGIALSHKFRIITTLPFCKYSKTIFAQRKPNSKLPLFVVLRKISNLIFGD